MVRCRNGFPLRCFFLFSRFIQGLSDRYPELYEEPSGDASQHQINFGKKWGAYSTIAQLANEDITKFDEITQLPLETCLLYLSYLSDKVLTEQLIHKETMNKYKVK